ncbi:MAG: pilus assembly protein PilM [Candidatus Omnitrophica bacterium]|nr:pilus assembly protein PilM [Candidatus Omnitrophota bacterium]
MHSLGIYFGPQIICIVETKAKQLINNIGILRSKAINVEPSEEKVTDEVKIAGLIKEELKNRHIEAKEAILTLSGKDLIIRSFLIPILPHEELFSAVNFEVRKYIPFKVEDLISDYQCHLDKTIKKNRVLFVGIKREIFEKYLNIIKELGFKISSIEYSAFSVLKFLKLSDVREKGIIANINIDLVETDEINFVVLEDGFPLFSRDITLAAGGREAGEAKEANPNLVLEKLKREIRISLDYYDRTFPTKTIKKIFFLMDQDFRPDLEAFIKEATGLSIQFINFNKAVNRYIGKPIPFSLSFIKAYCSSLTKVETAVKINLLTAKEKTAKKISTEFKSKSALPFSFKPNLILSMVCLLLCIVTFFFGVYRILPLQKDLKNMKAMHPEVSAASLQANYDEVANTYNNVKARIKSIGDVIRQQLYFSEVLDVLPRVMPESIWLIEISFNKAENQAELTMRGTAFLDDSNKELELVNTFLARLKESQVFNKYFRNIEIVSVDYGQVKNVTSFIITCRK